MGYKRLFGLNRDRYKATETGNEAGSESVTKGRPSKLTNELAAELFEILRTTPVSIEAACGLVGISVETFNTWRAKGEDGYEGNADYAAFAADCRYVLGESERTLIEKIDAAADADPKHWRAASFLLAHRFPNIYSRRQIEDLAEKRFQEKVRAMIDSPVLSDRTKEEIASYMLIKLEKEVNGGENPVDDKSEPDLTSMDLDEP